MNITFRAHRPGDQAELAKVAAEAAQADGVDPRSTLEHIPTEAELRNPDLVIATDGGSGEVLGYGAVRRWREDDGTLVYLHSWTIRPSARGRGVETVFLHELQARIRKVVAHDKAKRKVFAANASESEKALNELLVADGYQRVWAQVEMSFTDLKSVARVPVPVGFELRRVKTVKEQRMVYEANKRIYEGQFGSSAKGEEDYQEFLEDSPDMSLWKVLWRGTKVAGFVLSRMRDSDAEVMEVSVLPEYRLKGLGTYLMIESLHELLERGVKEVRLHTGAEGKMGGRQLYTSLGFRALKEHYRYRKPIE